MIWCELTHWPTHPPTDPPIHLSKGGSVSTNHKSSNIIQLSQLDQVLLKFLWFYIFRPTNPPIHPPTHQKNTHPWVGNSPQIPNLQTESKYLDSFKSYRIFTDLGRYPPGGWMGGWVGVGLGRDTPHACTCARTCASMHAHARAHTHACMLNMINMAASMVAAICNFLTCLSSRFMHVRVCACMCTCLGTPPHAPRCPPTHLPPPQSRREPQGAQITKSL